MRALGLCLLGLLLAPTLVVTGPAAAQASVVPTALQVTVVDAGEALVPTRPTSLEVKVRYRWNPGAAPTGETEVYLGVEEAPEWANPVIDPVLLKFALPPAQRATGGAVEKSAVINLTLKENAQAFDRQNVSVRAVAKPNGNLAGAEAVSAPITIMPAYVGRLELETPQTVVTRGGVATTVEFLVRNIGNGATDVRWRLPLKPEESRMEAEPQNLTLAVGEERVVNLTLRTPWTKSARGQLVIEATPIAAGGTAEGNPAMATIEVAGQSAMPSPGPALLAPGLAFLALALRRRPPRA